MFQYHHFFPSRARVLKGGYLLITPIGKFARRWSASRFRAAQLPSAPIQLLCLPDNLFLIPLAAFDRHPLLVLVGKIRRLHLHSLRISEPQTGVIEHLDRQVDGLWSEIHDQCITLELSPIVLIHLDPGLTAINLLSDDAALGEDGVDFFESGVRGKRGHVDGCVDAGLFGFLGRRVLDALSSDHQR